MWRSIRRQVLQEFMGEFSKDFLEESTAELMENSFERLLKIHWTKQKEVSEKVLSESSFKSSVYWSLRIIGSLSGGIITIISSRVIGEILDGFLEGLFSTIISGQIPGGIFKRFFDNISKVYLERILGSISRGGTFWKSPLRFSNYRNPRKNFWKSIFRGVFIKNLRSSSKKLWMIIWMNLWGNSKKNLKNSLKTNS